MASNSIRTAMISSSEIFVFLHGFTQDGGVGGGGQIAKYVASLFHVPVEQPDLNQPSFDQFSVTNALKVIDQLYENKQKELKNEQIKMNLIGASMGGYIATRYAELHPNRVKKLFLLCPAFGLAARWREFVSSDALAEWKSSGSYSYDGRQLHYEFFNDITSNHPAYPHISCPTSIVHGKNDRIVPIEASRMFISEQIGKNLVNLVEVDDDHYLTKSLQRIIPIASRRQAAAEAADRRSYQSETRGVDEDELRRMKHRQNERDRIEGQQAKLPKQNSDNGLRWQMN